MSACRAVGSGRSVPPPCTGTKTVASALKHADDAHEAGTADSDGGGKAKLYGASVAFGVGVAAHKTFGVLASGTFCPHSPRVSSAPSSREAFEEAAGDRGEPVRFVVVRRLPDSKIDKGCLFAGFSSDPTSKWSLQSSYQRFGRRVACWSGRSAL